MCLCCLGRGTYGYVKLYQCKEASTECCGGNGGCCNQYFVVKKILNRKEKYRKLLRDEYTIGINVDHQNIIKTFDIDLIDNSLILEYCGGIDMYTYIVYNTSYDPWETYVTYFEQLVGAVEYLHSRGIAHLDIKPENILIKSDEKMLKLIDLGMAVVFKNSNGNKIQGRGIRGSPAYLPPEVFEGVYDYDKVDIWSCGIVLYNIIYKTQPWLIAEERDEKYKKYKQTNKFMLNFTEEKCSETIIKALLIMLERDTSTRSLHSA